MDLRFSTELSRIATECDEDPAVRCVLIDAAGKFFGVGADLKTSNRDRAALPIFVKNATVGMHSPSSTAARRASKRLPHFATRRTGMDLGHG
ncbi:MAG: hypothetical protein ACXWIG_04360 [Caldimonas sp.]